MGTKPATLALKEETMKAAKNFIYAGGKHERRRFRTGDEIPKDIIDDIDDDLVLEKLSKSDPNKLSREQLMVMAGLDPDADLTEEELEELEEFDEDQFREGLDEFTTKSDLVEWASESLGISGLDESNKRADIEDQIVALMKGDEPEDNT